MLYCPPARGARTNATARPDNDWWPGAHAPGSGPSPCRLAGGAPFPPVYTSLTLSPHSSQLHPVAPGPGRRVGRGGAHDHQHPRRGPRSPQGEEPGLTTCMIVRGSVFWKGGGRKQTMRGRPLCSPIDGGLGLEGWPPVPQTPAGAACYSLEPAARAFSQQLCPSLMHPLLPLFSPPFPRRPSGRLGERRDGGDGGAEGMFRGGGRPRGPPGNFPRRLEGGGRVPSMSKHPPPRRPWPGPARLGRPGRGIARSQADSDTGNGGCEFVRRGKKGGPPLSYWLPASPGAPLPPRCPKCRPRPC